MLLMTTIKQMDNKWMKKVSLKVEFYLKRTKLTRKGKIMVRIGESYGKIRKILLNLKKEQLFCCVQILQVT